MKSKFYLFGMALLLILSLGACKSKESAYKAAYEKAKEKEMGGTSRNSEADEVVSVSKPKQTATNVTSASFQKEKVTVVDGTGMKRYNVVIGSFTNRTNATALKERMVAKGYKVVLAQNERQMYRVIVASFDDKSAAALERNAFKEKYYPDFQDIWLLELDY